MDRIGARLLCSRYDGVDVQVALRRCSGADQVRLVGETNVTGPAVGLGKDGHARQTEVPQGPYDPDRYLPAICDEDFFKHEGPP